MVSKYSALPGPRLGALGSGAVGLMIHCDRCKTRNFMPIGRALHLWGVRTSTRRVVNAALELAPRKRLVRRAGEAEHSASCVGVRRPQGMGGETRARPKAGRHRELERLGPRVESVVGRCRQRPVV